MTAQRLDSLFDADKTMVRRASRLESGGRGLVKSTTVVFNRQIKGVRLQFEPEVNFGGLRVLDDIVQSLLDGKKYIMAQFGW